MIPHRAVSGLWLYSASEIRPRKPQFFVQCSWSHDQANWSRVNIQTLTRAQTASKETVEQSVSVAATSMKRAAGAS